MLNFDCEINTDKDYLKPFDPLLNKWFDAVKRYQRVVEGDIPWWHIERANVSLLAGAAWLTREWVAIEEFTASKHGKEGNDKTGRCDLYLQHGNTSFAMEAKQAWQNVHSKDPFQEAIKMMDNALEAARELKSDEADYRLAVTFIVPYFKENRETNLMEWIGGLKKVLTWDIFAYIRIEEQHNQAIFKNEYQNCFPGVCMAIKEIKRAKSKSS